LNIVPFETFGAPESRQAPPSGAMQHRHQQVNSAGIRQESLDDFMEDLPA